MHRTIPMFTLLLAAACATPAVKAPEPASPIDAHFVARQRALARMAKNFERVHFEFDSSRITLQTRDALFANVEIMRNFPEISLEIEGHCDEVGSTEYNLALGQRRAEAIKKYMVAAGVASGRVDTISFGKELPLDGTRSQKSFATNRRAEFRLSYAPHPDVHGTVAAADIEAKVFAARD